MYRCLQVLLIDSLFALLVSCSDEHWTEIRSPEGKSAHATQLGAEAASVELASDDEWLTEAITLSDEVDPRLHRAILIETNLQREAHGLEPLGDSEVLENAALGHAQDMVDGDFFSHDSIVRGKETLRQRVRLAGGEDLQLIGENIATNFGIDYIAGRAVHVPSQNGGYFGYERGEIIPLHTYRSFARTAVQAWMDSPGHRRNILQPRFRNMGAGVALEKSSSEDDIPSFKLVQVFSS